MMLFNYEQFKAEKFVKRMRRRMASPMHKFKKTDKLNLQIRYPHYREESEEEKQAASPQQINLATVITRGYDSEILAKLKSFLEFIKRIFKG